MPGGGCALPGLRAVSARSVTIQAGQAQRRPAAGKRSAARQRAASSVAGLMPGGGCALPGLRGCLCPLRNAPDRASAAPPGSGQPRLAAAVGRPPARGDEKRQMEMVLCRLADNKINLRPGKDALAPGAGKPRPGFRC